MAEGGAAMHALICQGNGKYYVSAVFGYYRDVRLQMKRKDVMRRFINPIGSFGTRSGNG